MEFMKFTSLTPRERDVPRLVPSGMRNKQIAKKLGSPNGRSSSIAAWGCANLG